MKIIALFTIPATIAVVINHFLHIVAQVVR